MTIQEHLQDRLINPQTFPLTDEERKRIKFEGLEQHLYKRLTATKFRRSSLDAEAEQQLRSAIKLNVSKGQPLKFTYPFGCYKIFRVPSYPTVDWAEFLAISHLIRYVKYVVSEYKPGAEIYFSADDVVIEKIDNYPRQSIDAYVESFQKLIKAFKKYLPSNIALSLKRVVPDIYDSHQYTAELEDIVSQMRKDGLSAERKESLKKGFEFNFLKKGRTDYSNTPKVELDRVVEDLMYYSDGYLKLTKRRDFVRGEDKIVVFSMKIPNAVDIGSTTVSKAKFWAGIGALEVHDGKVYDRVLSPKQFDQSKQRARFEKIDLIDIPALSTIPVFDERLAFRS